MIGSMPEWGAVPSYVPRVLVVEDDLPVMELLKRALKGHYQVFAYSRGEEALAILRKERFSLVIADLWLPGVGGLEILRAVNGMDDPPAVIIITGAASLNSAIQATNDGALAYITKPFNLDHLVSRVAKVLAQWETSRYARNLQKRIQRLLVLNQASHWMGRTQDLQEVLENTLQTALQLTGMGRALVLLLDDDHSSIFPIEEALQFWRLDAEQGTGARALADRRPVVVGDAPQDPQIPAELHPLGVESWIVLPLVSGAQPKGLLYVLNDHPTEFSQDQVDILSILASQTAVAIDNTQLLVQLQQACERLQELDQLKDEFISLVSHELRTPLHSIGGFVQLLMSDKIDDQATRQDCLIRVAEQTEHLRRLVEELLDLSRIEAGRLVINRAPLSLGSVLEDVAANLKQMADEKGVALEVVLPVPLPLVEADGQRLAQVITNLVHNGIKFTPPPGQVRVAAERVNGEVLVRVVDSGPGIPAEALPGLFERFYQVNSPSIAHHEGMGIGLYISKRIVQAHGGRIWAQSEVGRGSTFYVALPLSTLT
jgi:signal transduction histidine kinase/DNA-binding response OmpR family regulator